MGTHLQFISFMLRGFLVCAVMALFLFAPEMAANNHGNRYSDAYKQYLEAECPVPEDGIKHFVYFARNRNGIRGHALLGNSRFAGAQIMYSWATLEPAKGKYDFSTIQEDYAYLKSHGKQLFIQLQDATFDPDYKGVPGYL